MVLFDNADDFDVQQQDFIHYGPKSDVLITTRQPDGVVRLAKGCSCWNLSGMDSDEAQQLLIRSARLDESSLSDDEEGTVAPLVEVSPILRLCVFSRSSWLRARRTSGICH
jgi:hypothetical protein